MPSATPPNGRGMADTHRSPGFAKLARVVHVGLVYCHSMEVKGALSQLRPGGYHPCGLTTWGAMGPSGRGR